MPIVRVFDFETSGTEPPEAEVCEVGYSDLNVNGKTVSPPVSWLCRVKAMPPEVRAVHHLSLEDTLAHEPFAPSRIVDDFVPEAFAAHNASFEQKFYQPPTPLICTYKAGLRVWPDAPAHNNGALFYWLLEQGLIDPDPSLCQPFHRAGPDSYVTAHILLALFNAGQSGADMVRWTYDPAMLPKCPIGEHRGKPWAEVDHGFLDWMMRQGGMADDLKWNAQREIDRRKNS